MSQIVENVEKKGAEIKKSVFEIEPVGCLKIDKSGKNLDGQLNANQVLDNFVKACLRDNTCSINRNIDSKNFNPSHALEYDTKYEIYIVSWKGEKTIQECIDFMKNEKFLLVGPTLLPYLKSRRKTLPSGVWLASLDLLENCFKETIKTSKETTEVPVFPIFKFDDDEDGWYEYELSFSCYTLSSEIFKLVCLRKKD